MPDEDDPHPPRYVAEPLVCLACAETEAAAAALVEENGGQALRGFKWSVAQVPNGRS